MQQETMAPDFLVIGHATRDLLPDGSWRLGGSVTYAARTAQQLGQRPAVVTSAPADVLAALRGTLPGVPIANIPTPTATTFENIYVPAGPSRRAARSALPVRLQHLRGHAAPLTIDAVPVEWQAAPIVLLAPLAGEIPPSFAAGFPHALVAATPQGWLRRWDATGRVYPGPLAEADTLLPRLQALILSREDLLPAPDIPAEALLPGVPRDIPAADALIAAWARIVPLVVVTRGPEGALLYAGGDDPAAFHGYPARELDPTGAGDVFAAAFLCELHATGDPTAAVDFANRVAALSVERPGTDGIPTRAALAARYDVLPHS
ncbi:MAG TPA: PfkB family carbohydrate kinase [Ktedonobacterales bacterium]|nr:PfkB family carbohydrate kinase [Ktedonobacterales bacterium]